MKLVLYTLIITLEMVAFSIQKDSKSEGINTILDQLIKQTEGEKDNTTKGESKGSNNQNVNDQSKYDIVSEEVVVEIETQSGNRRREEPINFQENVKFDDNDQVIRSAFPDDYLENDMLPEHTLDSYVPEIQKEPNLLSRYPDIIADPESNKNLNKNNALIKELAKDLMEYKNQANRETLLPESNTHALGGNSNGPLHNNQELEDDLLGLINFKKAPNKIFEIFGSLDNPRAAKKYPAVLETLPYPRNTFFDHMSERLGTLSLNTAVRHNILNQNYLDNSPLPMNFIPVVAYSLPSYATQPQNVIRTVIHHKGALTLPESQWHTGTCCTY